MAPKWIEAFTGSLEQKKRYKEAKTRLDTLPAPYASTARAIHNYAMRSGDVIDGEILVRLTADLADLWERAALDGTPIHEVVGDDPVEFTEEFVQAYGGKRWIDKERARLIDAVNQAKRDERR